jgi:hypothetical protein
VLIPEGIRGFVEFCKKKMRSFQSGRIKRAYRRLGKSEGSEERKDGDRLHDGRGGRRE